MNNPNVKSITSTKDEWLGTFDVERTGEWMDYAMHLVRSFPLFMALLEFNLVSALVSSLISRSYSTIIVNNKMNIIFIIFNAKVLCGFSQPSYPFSNPCFAACFRVSHIYVDSTVRGYMLALSNA